MASMPAKFPRIFPGRCRTTSAFAKEILADACPVLVDWDPFK